MVKQVNISRDQYWDLCEKFGIDVVDHNIVALNGIFRRRKTPSHTAESGIDYNLLVMMGDKPVILSKRSNR